MPPCNAVWVGIPLLVSYVHRTSSLLVFICTKFFIWALRIPPSSNTNVSKFHLYLETVDRRETLWICNSHLFLSSYLFFFFKNTLFYNTNPLPEKNSATFSTVADQGNPRARTTYSLVSSFMLSGLACKSKQINLTNDVLVTWSISQEFCLT